MGMGILIAIKCLLLATEWEATLEQFVQGFIMIQEIREFIMIAAVYFEVMEENSAMEQNITYFTAANESVRLGLFWKKMWPKIIKICRKIARSTTSSDRCPA